MNNYVIIAVDVTGSTAETVLHGDSLARKKIQKRLAECEEELRRVDPTLVRRGTASGDMFILLGRDLPMLHRCAVELQDRWDSWGWKFEPLPIRIAIGYGPCEITPDGERGSVVTGTIPNLVCSLVGVCENGRVVTTFGVYEQLVSYGPVSFAFKLKAQCAHIKGYDEQVHYYQSNGHYSGVDRRRPRQVDVALGDEALLKLNDTILRLVRVQRLRDLKTLAVIVVLVAATVALIVYAAIIFQWGH